MVKLLPTEQFIESIGRAMKVRMDLSLYYGNQFECACGKEHKFDYRTKLLCQGYWRVVMVCPDDESHLTNVKIKMFLMVKEDLRALLAITCKTKMKKWHYLQSLEA